MNKQKVFDVVSRVPKGKVLTYKQVAQLSGVKSPRVVGNILHKNKDPQGIPCHRVVNSRGEVAQNYVHLGEKDYKRKNLKPRM